MSRQLVVRWVFVALAAALLGGCGNDSTGDGGDNVKPVTIDGSIVVPDAWAGTWEITLTFRDCVTNAIHSEEVIQTQICPGDTLVNPFAPVMESCTGTRTGNHLDVDCSYENTAGACTITLDVKFVMDVSGGTLAGNGTIESTATPGCGNTFTAGCEKLEISGTRLLRSTAGCDTLTTTQIGRAHV